VVRFWRFLLGRRGLGRFGDGRIREVGRWAGRFAEWVGGVLQAAEFAQAAEVGGGAIVGAFVHALVALDGFDVDAVGEVEAADGVGGAEAAGEGGVSVFELFAFAEEGGVEQTGFDGPDAAETPVSVGHLGDVGFLGDALGLPFVKEATAEFFIFMGTFVSEDDGFGGKSVDEGGGGGALFAFGRGSAEGFAAVFACDVGFGAGLRVLARHGYASLEDFGSSCDGSRFQGGMEVWEGGVRESWRRRGKCRLISGLAGGKKSVSVVIGTIRWDKVLPSVDAETGLDYFGARYFSGMQGRFTCPDEPLVDEIPEYPQSWNLYSYVRNNPLKFIDPTGEDRV
jgi:RHS repeat-associated protein